MKGINLMDKVLHVQGARIAFRIWDVGGMIKLISSKMLIIFVIKLIYFI